jgi:hypothetical protein
MNALMSASDGCCVFFNAKVHDSFVAVEPKSECSQTTSGLGDDWFGDNVAINGKHRGPLNVELVDLAHETTVADAVAFLLGSAVSIGIAMVPLGSHDAPEEGDKFPGPCVARALAAIELHGVMVPG